MGKITVKSTGDWHPGRREKSYRENFDGIFRQNKRLQEIDPGYVKRLTKLTTQMTHSKVGRGE